MTPNINLLPKQEQKKSPIDVKTFFVVIVLLVLIIWLVWQYWQARTELTELTDKETTLLIEQSEQQSKLGMLKAEQQSPIEVADAFVKSVVYPVTPLLDELHHLQSSTMYLRSYEFGSLSVSIIVDFEMLTDVSTFVTKLTNSPYFQDVKVGSIAQFSLARQDSSQLENLPRYSVDVELEINQAYLAAEGEQP